MGWLNGDEDNPRGGRHTCSHGIDVGNLCPKCDPNWEEKERIAAEQKAVYEAEMERISSLPSWRESPFTRINMMRWEGDQNVVSIEEWDPDSKWEGEMILTMSGSYPGIK